MLSVASPHCVLRARSWTIHGGELFRRRAIRGMRRIVLALAAASLTLPSVASATDLPGTYVVSSCALGDQPIPLTGWYREVPNDRHLADTCGVRDGSFSAARGGQA